MLIFFFCSVVNTTVGLAVTEWKLFSSLTTDPCQAKAVLIIPSYWSYSAHFDWLLLPVVLCHFGFEIFSLKSQKWIPFSLPHGNWCFSVTQLCPTVCHPKDCNTPGFPVLHHLPEFVQTLVQWVNVPYKHLILCHPILLLPWIFPSIRILSKELDLCIRWPKYWNFSFSISPSNEHPGLMIFRMDWFDLLAVQGTLKSLLQNIFPKL